MPNPSSGVKFPKVTYEAAEQIIADYQARKEGAAEKLVDTYRGYLLPFLNLLNTGELDLTNKPVRRFLLLFVKDPNVRRKISSWKYSRVGRVEAYKTKAMLQEKFKAFGRDEIYHELICVLLEMANRYERREQSEFHNYMWSAFHYGAFRNLSAYITDPLVWNADKNVDVDERSSESEQVAPSYGLYDLDKESVRTVDDAMETINDNWVNGLTCSPLFAELNPFERRILREAYLNDREDHEIADMLMTCRATVNRRRINAERAVFEAAESLGIMRGDADYIKRMVEADDREGEKRARRNLKRWRKRA